MLAAQPGRAVGIMLLLPDRHDLFDPLDRVPTGVERGVAMRGRHADDDARLPDRQRPDAMDDGDVLDAPALADLVADLRPSSLGGRRVCLIFEMRDGLATPVIAYGAGERRDGARARVSHERLGHPGIELLPTECETGACSPPLTGGISATSSPS